MKYHLPYLKVRQNEVVRFGKSACPLLSCALIMSTCPPALSEEKKSRLKVNINYQEFEASGYLHSPLPRTRVSLFSLWPSRCCQHSERLRSPVPPPMEQRMWVCGKCSFLMQTLRYFEAMTRCLLTAREVLRGPLTLAGTLSRPTQPSLFTVRNWDASLSTYILWLHVYKVYLWPLYAHIVQVPLMSV